MEERIHRFYTISTIERLFFVNSDISYVDRYDKFILVINSKSLYLFRHDEGIGSSKN